MLNFAELEGGREGLCPGVWEPRGPTQASCPHLQTFGQWFLEGWTCTVRDADQHSPSLVRMPGSLVSIRPLYMCPSKPKMSTSSCCRGGHVPVNVVMTHPWRPAVPAPSQGLWVAPVQSSEVEEDEWQDCEGLW